MSHKKVVELANVLLKGPLNFRHVLCWASGADPNVGLPIDQGSIKHAVPQALWDALLLEKSVRENVMVVDLVLPHSRSGDFFALVEIVGVLAEDEADGATVDRSLPGSSLTKRRRIEPEARYGLRRLPAPHPTLELGQILGRLTRFIIRIYSMKTNPIIT